MNSVLVLALAMGLDAVMGEPRWLWALVPHPAVVMGRLVAALDRTRNQGEMQRLKGVLAVLILVTLAGTIGWVLGQFGSVVTIFVAAILLAQKSLVDHVAAVATGLRQSNEAGRQAVALIVSRDVSTSATSATSRSAIESLSENFSDGVIAPAFWFLVAGLPGILVYKCLNTADSMIGYRTPRHEAFGWAAARLDDLANWIPARLSAALIMISHGTWRDIREDARKHRSPNAGWPEAAMAQVLDLALAGPRSYEGEMTDFPWVNDRGRGYGHPRDIERAVFALWRAWGLTLTILMLGTALL